TMLETRVSRVARLLGGNVPGPVPGDRHAALSCAPQERERGRGAWIVSNLHEIPAERNDRVNRLAHRLDRADGNPLRQVSHERRIAGLLRHRTNGGDPAGSLDDRASRDEAWCENESAADAVAPRAEDVA